jgi:hypothetical protein
MCCGKLEMFGARGFFWFGLRLFSGGGGCFQPNENMLRGTKTHYASLVEDLILSFPG